MKFFRRKLSCKQVEQQLQMYLDTELDEKSAKKVADHLEMCQDCAFEADLMTKIKMSLKGAEGNVDPGTLARLNQFANRISDFG